MTLAAFPRPAAWAAHDLSARRAVRLACSALALVLAIDLMDGRIAWMFPVGFCLIVFAVALAIERASLFTAGMLPIMLLVGALAVVVVLVPSSLQIDGLPEDAGHAGRWLAAVIDHGVTLVVGNALAIVVVVLRRGMTTEAAGQTC